MSSRASRVTRARSEQEAVSNDQVSVDPALLQTLEHNSTFFARLQWFCGITAFALILFLLKASAVALAADDY
jgi:hypothetical protein